MNILVVAVIAVIILFFLSTSTGTKNQTKEKYSDAALIQLYAKGPEDTYLSGDAWKHVPWWYYQAYPGVGPYYSPYYGANLWNYPVNSRKYFKGVHPYNYPYMSPYNYGFYA